MFKINKAEFDKMADTIINDVLENVKDENTDQLNHLSDHYGWVADSFEIDGHTLGSDEWAAAALNHGMQFKWPNNGPPFNKIADWVINTKDPAKFGHEDSGNPSIFLKREVFRIIKSIKQDGLQKENESYGRKHYWYFDDSISFVPQVSFDV